ncbi:zonadhesin-like [Stegodyphus dumicola]|uniref:zonadhesin-like n=1 Tax=Stegodyphus dumicola TaxID=202533 RepID=UPI0015AABFBE|nr:zonadhesin-like [Stegodyphus dumicola]
MDILLVILLHFSLLLQFSSGEEVLCKENEEYNECGSGCPLTCSNYLEPIFCTKLCIKGCFCKPGYIKGPGGKCILPEECPVGPCRENERPTQCVIPCNTCAQRGKCYNGYCNKGCDCKLGFYRNYTGHCIPGSQCDLQDPLPCPRNEHFVPCVSLCNDCYYRGNCEEIFCEPGCDCKPGYFRNENDECVPENRCFSDDVICGDNEEYTDCVIPCNDCIKRGNCPYSCVPGCDCKIGYYKNSTGICIPAYQCPLVPSKQRCPVNEEYYRCMPTCRNTCDTYHAPVVRCTATCRSGCSCKPGLVRRNDGVCVSPAECPKVCKEDEEYKECGTACPFNCTNFDKKFLCTQQCIKGCFCKPGYIRGPEGTCIIPSNCPTVCQANEEYQACGTACPFTCANFKKPFVCTQQCIKGCFCKSGFIRGPSGKCIDPAYCPKECKENEEYTECGSACPPTCSNQTTTCSQQCIKGCFCKPGYVRNPDGQCILPRFCPVECKANEDYRQCGSTCPPTCDTYRNPIACIEKCVQGCFCKAGFVRDPHGNCVLPSNCPIVCNENEEYHECGSACPRTCNNTLELTKCQERCVKGCFCKPSYVRGPQGSCILPSSCPMICKENEEYRECGSACPPTCSNPGPVSCAERCIKGCFCKTGFVRDPHGKCVLPTSCPTVCRKNEIFKDCAPACPTTCDNFRRSLVCKLPCVRGCTCKYGYVQGPDRMCILPTSCPQTVNQIQGRSGGSLDDEETTVTSDKKTTIAQPSASDTTTPGSPTENTTASSQLAENTTASSKHAETTLGTTTKPNENVLNPTTVKKEKQDSTTANVSTTITPSTTLQPSKNEKHTTIIQQVAKEKQDPTTPKQTTFIASTQTEPVTTQKATKLDSPATTPSKANNDTKNCQKTSASMADTTAISTISTITQQSSLKNSTKL